MDLCTNQGRESMLGSREVAEILNASPNPCFIRCCTMVDLPAPEGALNMSSFPFITVH